MDKDGIDRLVQEGQGADLAALFEDRERNNSIGPHSSVGAEAAYGLERIGTEEATQALVRVAINHEIEPWIREAAVHSIGPTGHRSGVSALVSLLDEPEDQMDWYGFGPGIRAAAAISLGELGGDEAMAGLIHALDFWETEKYEACRTAALEGLGNIGGAEVLNDIELFLEERCTLEERFAAIEAMEQIIGRLKKKVGARHR